MTSRRDFLRHAVATSLAACVPIARAQTAPPHSPVPLYLDGQLVQASGFNDDPYSSYATWYLDGLNGTDTPHPGTDRQPAGYVYKTLQNAMVDVFYASGLGPRRIIVRATATYTTLGAGSDAGGKGMGYFKFGGSGPTSQYIVQGDPASATCPIFDNGVTTSTSTTNSFIAIGSNGYNGTEYNNLSYITIRKLEFRNNGSDDIYFYWGQSSYVTIEFCSFHDNIYPSSQPSSAGGIGITNPGNNATSHLTVRYCKFYNIWGSTGRGSTHPNADCICTYGSDFLTIENCYFANAYAGFRTKEWSGGNTVNNLTIQNNIFSGVYAGIHTAPNQVPQTAVAMSNATITNNLFYGQATGVGLSDSNFIAFNIGQPYGTQGSNILIANNTSNGTSNDLSWPFATSVTARDNLFLSSASHIQTFDPSSWGSIYGTVFSQLDYNAYGGASSWALDAAKGYPYPPLHSYSTFAAWQAASGSPDLGNITRPDAHGIWIPNLPSPYNTVAGNMVDPNYATSGNFTLAAKSPLQTASSTGGPVGCNIATIGPGW